MKKSIATQRYGKNFDNRRRARKARPFWLPASNFYILSAAAAIAFFFFLWWILHEGGEEIPYVPAGIGASLLLGGAVFLREVVLKRARQRYLLAQEMLDRNLKKVEKISQVQNQQSKFTLKHNASIIENIQKKSDAALILDKFSDGHWEVFQLCNDYLYKTKIEMRNVGAGSPRLAAFRRGREIVGKIHKAHLLRWAEIESRMNLKNSKNQLEIAEKLGFTQKALEILDTALEYYPDERQLRESVEAVQEFNSSIKIAHLVESAEKASFRGNQTEAVNLYRDALFFMKKEKINSDERQLIEKNVLAEIEKIEENLQIEQ